MLPNTDEDSGIKKSKPFIGIRLMSKILPAYYNKKDTNNYVFDAIPAVPREGSNSGLGLSLTSNNNSLNYGNTPTNGLQKHKTNKEEREDDKNFDQDAQDKTKKEERKDKANENNKSFNEKTNIPPDEKSFHKNIHQTNIYGGTNIQIGHIFSTVNNNTMVYNTNNMQFGENCKNQQGSKKKRNPAVKTLLKSKNQIENRHLQFLSCHFGNEWKDIGKYLNLTKEEISNKKFNMKEPQERSYQMMLAWAQKPENRGTTLGSLCKILWDSQKKAAQQAVEQLAANLNDLD